MRNIVRVTVSLVEAVEQFGLSYLPRWIPSSSQDAQYIQCAIYHTWNSLVLGQVAGKQLRRFLRACECKNFYETDLEWALQLNRFSLRLVGLWPEEDVSSRARLASDMRLFGAIIAFTSICTAPSLLSLVKVWGDMTAMIDNMVFTLPFVTLSVKMIILRWKKKTLSPLMTVIAHDWLKTKSRNERHVMIRCAHTARLIITCSYIVILSTLVVMIITCSLGYSLRLVNNTTEPGRELIMQVDYYLCDMSVTPLYEIMFCIQCVTLLVLSLCYTGVDNFIGLLVFHICGQMENFTGRLYRMRESEDFAEALRINVREHIRLIRLVATIEDTFTLMLLLMFLIFGALFCVYGFLFIIVISEEENVPVKRAVFLILTLSTSFIHMCIYCAVGELLVIKYEKVYNAVYECEWYMLDTKQAKNLILLMVRTNKPLYITAGKMFPMTMSTFCNILKTSGGYISVLLANRK